MTLQVKLQKRLTTHIQDDLKLPENIKNDYYKFYVVYNSPDGGMQADWLLLVNKETLRCINTILMIKYFHCRQY